MYPQWDGFELMAPPDFNRTTSESTPGSSIPRGPPRKPKQSGHALWVGNLPPETNILDLKDHFSRDATRDIESLFLISKSNCAFVNYRSEAACTAAMHRFHDSRFHGVRLVCRLRRSSAPAIGTPTGPSVLTGTQPENRSPQKSPVIPDEDANVIPDEEDHVPAESQEGNPAKKVPEKFFIVKSLTLQDLELSVRNGIWATQAHNEEVLNKAFSVRV
jgi:RNA recognition motif-containing protein